MNKQHTVHNVVYNVRKDVHAMEQQSFVVDYNYRKFQVIFHHSPLFCKKKKKKDNIEKIRLLFRHLQDNLIKRIPRDGTFRRLRSLRTLYVIEMRLVDLMIVVYS